MNQNHKLICDIINECVAGHNEGTLLQFDEYKKQFNTNGVEALLGREFNSDLEQHYGIRPDEFDVVVFDRNTHEAEILDYRVLDCDELSVVFNTGIHTEGDVIFVLRFFNKEPHKLSIKERS